MIDRAKLQKKINKHHEWAKLFCYKNFIFWGGIASFIIILTLRGFSENLCLTYFNQILLFYLFFMFFLEIDLIRVRKTGDYLPFLRHFQEKRSEEKNLHRFLTISTIILTVIMLSVSIIFYAFESQKIGLCVPAFYTILRFYLILFIIQTLFLLIDSIVELKGEN